MGPNWHSSNRARLFATSYVAAFIDSCDAGRDDRQFAASLIYGNTDTQVIGFTVLFHRLN